MSDNTNVIIAACKLCGSEFEKRSVALFCLPCRPEAERLRVARYVAAHPDRRRESRRRWRLANPELNEAVAKRWRDANPEKLARYRSISKKRNPIANRSYVRARKVRQRGLAFIPFTPAQLAQRLAFYGGLCWMCGRVADTIDHVKPIAKGGAHILANLRPACLSCNSRKGERWPLEQVA